MIFTDWCVIGLHFEYLCIYIAMEKTPPWRPVTKNALVPFQFLVTELLVFVLKVDFFFYIVFSYVCAAKHHPYMWQYHSFVSTQYGCATPAQNFELVLWLKISHLWWDCCYPLPHIEIVRVTQWVCVKTFDTEKAYQHIWPNVFAFKLTFSSLTWALGTLLVNLILKLTYIIYDIILCILYLVCVCPFMVEDWWKSFVVQFFSQICFLGSLI